MSKRQLLALFLCSLVPWTTGNGLIPLLPIYATELGAAPEVAGYYLASSYLALAMGTIVAGWLSDRVGRKRFMAFCYAAGAVGLLVLMVSVSLWHFWIAALLHVILMIKGSVGSALVTDLVPRESLGRGMSLFGAAGWVGGAITRGTTLPKLFAPR